MYMRNFTVSIRKNTSHSVVSLTSESSVLILEIERRHIPKDIHIFIRISQKQTANAMDKRKRTKRQ